MQVKLPTALGVAAALVVTGIAGSAALAQRDPAYQAARAAGQVGERTDGYLGFVVSPSPELRALIDDLNIRRRSVYTERAAAARSTVEQMAFTAACNLIAQTAVGEYYQAPDGSWLQRSSAPPVRDSRCV